MAPHSSLLLYTLLTFSLSFHGIFGIGLPKYVVTNESPTHPGGIRFEKELGGPAGLKKMLPKITTYIWLKVLKQNNPADRKPVDVVTIKINDCSTCGQAMVQDKTMTISTIYLRDFKGPLTLQKDFIRVLHHEMTHVLQWLGEHKSRGMVEGIADYTILKGALYPHGFFANPGQGKQWDQGYDFTARFLEYCDGLVPDFVPKINNMMKNSFNVSFFQNLTGKPVEQLWTEYKAKYGNIE